MRLASTSGHAGEDEMGSNRGNCRPSSSKKRWLDARAYRAMLKPKKRPAMAIDSGGSGRKDSTEGRIPETLPDQTKDVKEGHSSDKLEAANIPAQSCSNIISGGAFKELTETCKTNQNAPSEIFASHLPREGCDHPSVPSSEIDDQSVRGSVCGNLSAQSEFTTEVNEGICDFNPEIRSKEETATNISIGDSVKKQCDTNIAETQKACPTLPGISDLNSLASEEVGGDSTTTQNIDKSNDVQYTENETCVKCKRPGLLLNCSGQGCTQRYHLSCISTTFAEFSSGNRYCPLCTEKMMLKTHSLSEEMESIVDSRGVHSSDLSGAGQEKEFLVKYKSLSHVHNKWVSEKELLSKAPFLLQEFNKKSKKDKLLSLPEGSLIGPIDDYLHTLNQLRENRLKRRSLILLDEQEKIGKIIMFILKLSAEPDVTSPFLILSSSESILLWESEFKRLAPSLNFLVYSGSKDSRKIIRDLEFYQEDGSVKFQAILSLPESILEDYDSLSLFRWETLIVDDCQNFRVSRHLDQLNKLPSDFRLLLADGQLQDNIGVYLSLLSFLDAWEDQRSEDDGPDNGNSRMSNLAYAKERLSHFTICNRKAREAKYSEYWVPVELSTVQLEQNCSALISQALMLQSPAKTDRVGALSSIVITQRKCCDHPYLVDDLLQATLTENLSAAENLDVGIRASGKLELLDRILHEIRDRRQRVVVLYQVPRRDGKCCIGDILDDFLRQRFGVESYERIDSGVSSSKKQSCLNMFNIKEKGRFVFLIETRACSSSVRLTSVDAVIIFSSDWNPSNDFRALQRIHLDSSAWPIHIFRFYSVFSLEEKALLLAKQDFALDSNVNNFSSGISRALLRWGASHAFDKIDEFHASKIPTVGPVSYFKTPILKEVTQELQTLLSKDDAMKCPVRFSMISKCECIGTHYPKDLFLLGEKESACTNEEEPSHVFWSKLLDGRTPRWKFVSQRSPWARTKPCFDFFAEKDSSGDENAKSRKRYKKMRELDDPKRKQAIKSALVSANARQESGTVKDRDVNMQQSQTSSSFDGGSCRRGSPSLSPGSESTKMIETGPVETGEKTMACHLQKDIDLPLKRTLEQLCESLHLSSNVREMAEMFLNYIIKNHQITPEPEAIVQALLISLCWRAASTLKQNLDHETSLIQAKKLLKFQCSREETEFVYKKVRMLRKKSQLKEDFRQKTCIELKSHAEGGKNIEKDIKNEELEEGEIPPQDSQIQVLEVQPTRSDARLALLREEAKRLRIDLFEKLCSKRVDMLRRKHELELEQLNCFWENQGTKLKKALEVQQDWLLSLRLPCEVLKERSDFAEEKFQNRMCKFEVHMKSQLKRLISLQAEAKNKEQKLMEFWVEEMNTGRKLESFECLPLEDTCFSIEEFDTIDQPVNSVTLSNTRRISSCLPVHASLPTTPALSRPSETALVMAAELPASLDEPILEISDNVEDDPLGIHDQDVASSYADATPTGIVESYPSSIRNEDMTSPFANASSSEIFAANPSSIYKEDVTSPLADTTQNNEESHAALSPTCSPQQIKQGSEGDRRSNSPVDEGARGMSTPNLSLTSDSSPLVQLDLPSRDDVHSNRTLGAGRGSGTDCLDIDSVSSVVRAAAVESLTEDSKPNLRAPVSAPLPQLVPLVLQPAPVPSLGPQAEPSLAGAVVTPQLGSVSFPSPDSSSQVSSDLPGRDDFTLPQLASRRVANGNPEAARDSDLCQTRDDSTFESQIVQHSTLTPAVQSNDTIGDGGTGCRDLNDVTPVRAAAVVSQAEDSKPVCTASPSAALLEPARVPLQQPAKGPASDARPNSGVRHVSLSMAGATVTPQVDFVSLPVVATQESIPSASSTASTAVATGVLGGLNLPSTVPRLPQVFPPCDPLLLEMMKIQRQEEKETELHDMKRQRALSEREQELEAVRRKHDVVLKEIETAYVEGKKFRSQMYAKYQLNWALAQEMRSHFVNGGSGVISTASAAGAGSSFVQQQTSLPNQGGQRHGGFTASLLRPGVAVVGGDLHPQGSAPSQPSLAPGPTASLLPRIPPGYLLVHPRAPSHRPVLSQAAAAPLLPPIYDGWPPSLS